MEDFGGDHMDHMVSKETDGRSVVVRRLPNKYY